MMKYLNDTMATEQEPKKSSSTLGFRKRRKEPRRCKNDHSGVCFITMPISMWPFLLVTCLLLRFASIHRFHEGTYSFENSFTEMLENKGWVRSSEDENVLTFSFSKEVIARPHVGRRHHSHSWIYLLHKSSVRDAVQSKAMNESRISSSSSKVGMVDPGLDDQTSEKAGPGEPEMHSEESLYVPRPQECLDHTCSQVQGSPEPAKWTPTPPQGPVKCLADSCLNDFPLQLRTGLNKIRVKDEILSNVKRSKTCAGVEEMGLAAAGDTKEASRRLRKAIRVYFDEHGAERVRQLPPYLFCSRSFVVGKAQAGGFGNNIYKILTAAGLGIILNRSLIIAESSSLTESYLEDDNDGPLTFPFGDYVSYSSQAFSMREVKQLWSNNGCSSKYGRPLSLRVDLFDTPANSTVLCEDWTNWKHPILWFTDAQDAVAIQFLLKNRNLNLRSAARLVLGEPSQPDSRPNTFGELMMAIVEPKPEVRAAVEWALRRVDQDSFELPDIALHLRMQNIVSKTGLRAASDCIAKILATMPEMAHKRPRIVVLSDTPSAVALLRRNRLSSLGEIINFDYKEFLKSSLYNSSDLGSSLRMNSSLPPPAKRRDWGPLPRWVAVVDFFLAARAKHAVVSGANRRVATTYIQLVASLAAAYTLADSGLDFRLEPARFYSSFQKELLVQGLKSQGGWGHSWRPFGGVLSCHKQQPQCALTPLLPYSWWNGPWQSPTELDRTKMSSWGIHVNSDGVISWKSLHQFCRKKQKVISDPLSLALPPPKKHQSI